MKEVCGSHCPRLESKRRGSCTTRAGAAATSYPPALSPEDENRQAAPIRGPANLGKACRNARRIPRRSKSNDHLQCAHQRGGPDSARGLARLVTDSWIRVLGFRRLEAEAPPPVLRHNSIHARSLAL